MRHSPLLSRSCRVLGVPIPAVALRFSTGYAFHSPSGVKSKKTKISLMGTSKNLM
ncbi:MAG: hypothetical protein LBE12_11405 [Planctomycetaceae bacterium]|nr:hypothetical protein [Planctomycetaceae bacterium]